MSQPAHTRHFTIQEANMLLELIRPLMAEVLQLRQVILSKQPEIWPVVEKAAGNGGSKAATGVQQEFEALDNRVRRILATGVLIKDISTGLVDFPSWRDEQEVYLCWRYNEPEILYWHTLEGGFGGRQPI